jgi:HAD superfamily hydrolase (TIGR01509 family)
MSGTLARPQFSSLGLDMSHTRRQSSRAPVAPPDHAFIFDLDGTLADTMPAHFRAWTEVARRYRLSFPEPRFYSLGGVPTAKIAGMLISEAGLDLDAQAVALEKERVYVDGLLAPGAVIRAIPEVVAIAEHSRALGPLAVASGSVRRLVDRTLAALGIADWFAAVVTAEDTPRHKPEPDVFLEAARRLGADPARCTVYEDTDIGLEAARRAGMRPVDVRPLIKRLSA